MTRPLRLLVSMLLAAAVSAHAETTIRSLTDVIACSPHGRLYINEYINEYVNDSIVASATNDHPRDHDRLTGTRLICVATRAIALAVIVRSSTA